tara:strand:- start:10072 stop:10260 length:189 start_codon:yes stop_codon:yes gene_type:complete
MKRIAIRYHIEIKESHIDKVCRKARCGKRDLENDIKHMAQIAGRHRVYEFIEPFIEIKQEKK